VFIWHVRTQVLIRFDLINWSSAVRIELKMQFPSIQTSKCGRESVLVVGLENNRYDP